MSAALPVAPDTAAAFVDAMAEVKAPATVRRYLASLNHLHRAAGLSAPGSTEPVRLALRRMARARGVRQKQAAATRWRCRSMRPPRSRSSDRAGRAAGSVDALHGD